jgi:hypothetical protein
MDSVPEPGTGVTDPLPAECRYPRRRCLNGVAAGEVAGVKLEEDPGVIAGGPWDCNIGG